MAKRDRRAAAAETAAGGFEVISFRVPKGDAERYRDACYWSRVKFVDFARQALERELAKLQKEHNKGRPFASRQK